MSPKPLRRCLPFSAVSGMEDAKKALMCAAVDDDIVGVLIKGPTGTAKSVLVRAFGNLLPDREIISIPQNITDEQLFGGLDIEDAIISGKSSVKGGTLQRADRNILYLDNINLFDRRILGSVMESAESEKVLVEREGVSSEYDLRTTVIATMDPAEQPLPDSIADRFEMCVQSYSVDDKERRDSLILSNLEFDADPEGFIKRYSDAEREVLMQIANARKILTNVKINDADIEKIAQVCIDLNVKGHRADISVARVSKTLAALDNRIAISDGDIKEASVLCLLHRRRGPPKEKKMVKQEEKKGTPKKKDDAEGIVAMLSDEASAASADGIAERYCPDVVSDEPGHASGAGTVGEIISSVIGRLEDIDRIEAVRLHQIAGAGRRKDVVVNKRSGRYRGFRIPKGRTNDPAFDATVRAAAPYQRSRNDKGLSISIEPQDIREKIRVKRDSCSFLFAVDVSGSLVETGMMNDIKNGVKAMLMESYVQRDRVALMTFRTGDIKVSVPFTRSVEGICDTLDDTTAGDGTPIGAALLLIRDYLTNYLRKNPLEKCYVIMMTDGETTDPVIRGDPVRELKKITKVMQIPNTEWVIVDSSQTVGRINYAQDLADMLEARYIRLEDLRLA
ncbi:MAG: ATP-binding protein [Methanomassiliicoccaceae archaeon]|nr:ATP-binding protein [Methanomassiliicoccaceae archaeon]